MSAAWIAERPATALRNHAVTPQGALIWPKVEADMGTRNYLIEGVSGAGKTAVAEELQRRGYHVLHGDRELKYRGDPKTGAPLAEPPHESEIDKVLWQHEHLIWDIDKIKSVIADHSNAISFFCGGSRNFSHFIDLLDGVFVLEVSDLDALYRRLDERVALDPTDFGGKPEEKELVARLHATKEDSPRSGVVIDATAPIVRVVDEILATCVRADQGADEAAHGFGST